MALSQLAIIKSRPKNKPYLLLDGEGLHLQTFMSGGKLWRLRSCFGGKANMMSLGAFPAVSLKDVREKRGEIKKQIAAGINPSHCGIEPSLRLVSPKNGNNAKDERRLSAR